MRRDVDNLSSLYLYKESDNPVDPQDLSVSRVRRHRVRHGDVIERDANDDQTV